MGRQHLIVLRAATAADSALLFEWRNDPLTRAMSRNTAPVEWDAHNRWLSGAMARIRIAEDRGEPVGVVRFDRGGDGTELSWTVAPNKRGLGYGTAMLRAATACVEGRIVACIKPENQASARMVESCGFVLAETRDGLAVWTLRQGIT